MPDWPACLLDAQTRIVWRHHVLSGVPLSFGFEGRMTEDHVLWVQTAGRVDCLVAGRPMVGRAGCLLWVPPGVEHSARTPAGQRPFFGYSFRFRVLTPQGAAGFSPAVLWRERDPRWREWAAQVYGDCCLDDDWSAARIRCHLFSLYTGLQRDRVQREPGLSAEQRHLLLHLVDRRLGDDLRPADLAQAVGLTPDYFARLFRRSFGLSPRRWLVERRLARAAFLLGQGRRDIGGIARELGYADANFFSRQFAASYGVPPSRYQG